MSKLKSLIVSHGYNDYSRARKNFMLTLTKHYEYSSLLLPILIEANLFDLYKGMIITQLEKWYNFKEMAVLLGDIILVYENQNEIIFKFDSRSLTQNLSPRRYIDARGILNSNQKHIKYLICATSLLFM